MPHVIHYPEGTSLFSAVYPHRQVDCADEERCRALAEEFRALRRARGPARAAEEWFGPILDDWLGLLDDDSLDVFDCPASLLCSLGVAVNESLAMRDALIMAAVTDPFRWDRGMLMDFAAHPHEQATTRSMGRMLSASFDDPYDVPDLARMERAIGLCERMGEILPRDLVAQPFAFASYVAWWTGSKRALSLAVLALDVDGSVSLADIVVSAVLRGVMPAWVAEAAAGTADELADGMDDGDDGDGADDGSDAVS
ncbi:MAG: hypothetical protein UHD09_07705 [Bifidobacterium sp.]|nr:hypothetical protein [Bifidobacterium sp.]